MKILIILSIILTLISCSKDVIEPKQSNLVMVGDSRTKRTDWNQTFGVDNSILNLGVDGGKN